MTTLVRLAAYARPYRAKIIAGAFLLSIAGALFGAVVSALKPFVNLVLLRRPPAAEPAQAPAAATDLLGRLSDWIPTDQLAGWAQQNAFFQVPLLILAIFFVRGLFLYFGQYLTLRAGTCVIRDLRVELHLAVTGQSLAFFRAHPTGLVLSRILNDVGRLQRMMTTVLATLIRVGAMVPVLLIVAFLHDWRMSLVSIVTLPLLAYPMVRLGRRLRRASTASQESMATVAGRLTESLAGVKVIQGFGKEKFEVGRFRQAIESMLRMDLRAARAQSLAPALMDLLLAAVGAAVLIVAGRSIDLGRLDPGDFITVLACLTGLVAAVRRLNVLYTEIQHALAASSRVFEMLDRKREIRDRPDARSLPPFERSIRFEQVRFSYGDEAVLEDIDITIRKGEVIALVGPSGAGKSTLVDLLPRFYDPTSGRLLLDGNDIRELTLDSLRGQIGIVAQETILFDDTVRNNIAYGSPEVPLERVVAAARVANADGFIAKLPQGYDTALGERGARLSMGQRQRIAIARALLKAPPILILDEATSALDSESEALVQSALEALMTGRTSIVIAHRLATVRRADRILVVEAGRIVEQGTHAELLARSGLYARLHNLQFREPEP